MKPLRGLCRTVGPQVRKGGEMLSCGRVEGQDWKGGPLCPMLHCLVEPCTPHVNPGGGKGRGPGFHTIRTPGFA